MRAKLAVAWTAVMILVAGAAGADVLETRDGRRIEGTLRSATGDMLQFEADGSVHAIAIGDVTSLRFDAAPRASTQDKAAQQSARTAAAPTSFNVPPGTRLRVRIQDTVDPRIGAQGDRFSAALETPLVAGERVIVPAGTRVYGVVSEARTTGPVASRLKLELDQLALGDTLAPLVTGNHKVVQSHAAQAKGAPRVELRPDRIPAGTLLEFRLLQAVPIVIETSETPAEVP